MSGRGDKGLIIYFRTKYFYVGVGVESFNCYNLSWSWWIFNCIKINYYELSWRLMEVVIDLN